MPYSSTGFTASVASVLPCIAALLSSQVLGATHFSNARMSFSILCNMLRISQRREKLGLGRTISRRLARHT